MGQQTQYAIAIIGSYHYPEIQGRHQPRFVEDDRRDMTTYETVELAQSAIAKMEEGRYILANNEVGRPEYYVVPVRVAEYIREGRDYDNSNYDWDKCECDRNDGDCCGECQVCTEHMISQDRQYIRDNAETNHA